MSKQPGDEQMAPICLRANAKSAVHVLKMHLKKEPDLELVKFKIADLTDRRAAFLRTKVGI